MNTLSAAAALVLCAAIVGRCITVLYQAVPGKHKHPILFLGFGYSYVVLGAGAIAGALGLVLERHDLADLGLWAMLAGSTGLIAFDRRAIRCITSSDECPIEGERRVGP